MTETEVRKRMLDLFNQARQCPNTEFDASHFLDYLSHPPHSKNSLKNSFGGIRRYRGFMNALELEFSICFTSSDQDSYYSVDLLTKKILERIKNGRGNEMILKQRNNVKFWFEFLVIIILLIIYTQFGIHWFSVIMTIIFGAVVWWTIDIKMQIRNHNKNMSLKFMKKK